MKKLNIKSIKKLNKKSNVYDLTVKDNNNFFITNKNILTHNCDHLSINAQAALRGVMEEYHDTSRFLLTANYAHKIIPAIHSRCQSFHIEKLDKNEFTIRIATILLTENIEFDIETLDIYVDASYPDLRKCINMVEQNSMNMKLLTPTSEDSNVSDYKLEMVELFKNGKINDARKLICGKATPDDIEGIYRWLYDNIELLGNTEKQQDDAVLIIKQALVDHTIIADPEINLSDCLIRLKYNLK